MSRILLISGKTFAVKHISHGQAISSVFASVNQGSKNILQSLSLIQMYPMLVVFPTLFSLQVPAKPKLLYHKYFRLMSD